MKVSLNVFRIHRLINERTLYRRIQSFAKRTDFISSTLLSCKAKKQNKTSVWSTFVSHLNTGSVFVLVRLKCECVYVYM